MSNFNDFNIDYLRVLNSVLETKSVTKSARELGVTQSAVSHSLKKLREYFDDEIVYRVGNNLELTAKAQAMQAPLKNWFENLNSILKIEDFDPKTSKSIFTIATTDLIERLFAPSIVSKIQKTAPHVQLRFVRWHYDRIETGLGNAQYDLAIGVKSFDSPNIYQKLLYKEKLVSAARKDHPIFKKEITLEEFLSYPHVMSGSGDGRGSVDLYLEELNRKRELLYIVNSFASAPPLIENSDCILTAPKKFLELAQKNHHISLFETPMEVNSFTMKVYWARKYQGDQKNKWLRNLFFSVANQFE